MAATEQGAFVLGVQIDGVAQAISELERLERAADAVSRRLNRLGSKQDEAFKAGSFKEFTKTFQAIERANKALTDSVQRQRTLIGDLTRQYRAAVGQVNNLGASLRSSMATGSAAVSGVNNQVGQFNNSMESAIAKIVRYRIAFGIWQGIINLMREMIDTTREMDQTIVDLRKVMNPVSTDFEFLTQVAFNLGKRFSTSALEVAQSMRVWAQQGNDQVQVAKLVEATLLGVNSANLTATEATEALTAATKNFNVEAENAPELVDKWLAVQANFAVTSQDLANAVKAVGAAAQVAGVDLDQLNGIVAAIGSVTRKTGREVANSFKTMLARINRLPTVKAFQDLGIAVRKSQTELREIPDVLADLAAIWPNLTNAQQQNIAITVAGIRRYSDFAVLMRNFGEFTEATAVSFSALGQAQLAQQSQLTSFNSQIQRIIVSFQEIGFELANSGILEIATNLGRTLADTVIAIKPFAPLIIDIARGVGIFGGALGVGVAVAVAFRAIVVSLPAALGRMVTSANTSSFSITALANSFRTASTAGALLAASIRTVVAASGVLLAVGATISTLILLFDDFSLSADTAARSLAELNDRSKAEVTSNQNLANTLIANKEALEELARARQRIFNATDENLTAAERETIVQKQLLDAYEDTINKFPQLANELRDGSVQFDLSANNIAAALSKITEDSDSARVTLIRSARETREGFIEQLEQLGEGIEEQRNIIRGLQSEELLPTQGIFTTVTKPTGPNLTQTKQVFKGVFQQLVDQINQVAADSGLDQALRDTISDQLSSALGALKDVGTGVGLEDQRKAIREFSNSLLETLGQAQSGAISKTSDLRSEIIKLNRVISESSIIAKDSADGYFFIQGSANRLLIELTKLREEQLLFSRDNRQLGRVFDDLNLRFDEASRATSFYRQQLERVFDVRRSQEIKIAIQEQIVELAKVSAVTEQTVVDEERKLNLLKEEVKVVSGGFDTFKRKEEEIIARANNQLKVLADQEEVEQKKLDLILEQQGIKDRSVEADLQATAAVQQQETVIKGIRTAAQQVREETQGGVIANLKLFELLVGQSSEYSVLLAQASAYKRLLDISVDEQIAQKQAIFDSQSSLREMNTHAQFQLDLLRLREAGEKRIADEQLKNVRAQIAVIDTEEEQKALNIDRIEAANRLLKLREEEFNILKQIAGLPLKEDIISLQQSLNTELQKQQAISEVIAAQQEGRNQDNLKALEIERTRLIEETAALELFRQRNDLSQDDVQIIQRRAELTQGLLDIEKRIFLERIRISKEFEREIRNVASELGSVFASGLGGIPQSQVDRFNELKAISQDLADLEVERQQLIAQGNDEGLAETDVRMKDLLERQNELNSAMFIWKETLAEIANNLSGLINQKLAERFTEGLLSIQAGGKSVGDLLASGVVFFPDEAKFETTAATLNQSFNSAIVEASEIGSALFEERITRAIAAATAAGTGLTDGSLLSTKDTETLGDVAAAVESAGETTAKEITKGGQSAANSMRVSMDQGGDLAAAKLKSGLASGAQLLSNVLATSLFGGGQGASTGATLGGTLGNALGPVGGIIGSFLGASIGSLFDDSSVEVKQLDDFTDSSPLPVSVEEINEPQTILHDVSVAVEANFLDPTQLDPVALRNLAIHVREETESLLKRENIWGG